MLERCDRLRDGGLRHAEMVAGLGHAAVLGDGEQDVQIAQPDPPADPTVPVGGLVATYSPIEKTRFCF
jgi:hypothetical protein